MDRPTSGESQAVYRFRFGTADFDEARFELQVAGISVDVQRKPLEILRYLLRRAGEVVTKDELHQAVWEGRPTVENVVANALAKLRSALGEENAARIVTQARVGYRLPGQVERIAVGRALSSVLVLRPEQPVPGRDHFLLESLIGQSLGSEVWLARHTKTGERRVYKFSRDGEQLAALKREVTLSRVLQEGLGQPDAFVRLIDWNFATPPFFLECEYGGLDLAKWAESERNLNLLPLTQRLTIFQQIVDAVAAAHGVGVLHKDLKPSNVLIAPRADSWHVRVTDFGSGRLLEPDRLSALGITELGMTLTQSVLGNTATGTPLYLAPEILAGQPPTAQSDVYALGLLLYQLIIGDFRRTLSPGWERDIADELLREDIAAATDGDPVRRIATALELANRVRQIDERRIRRQESAAAEQKAARDAVVARLSRARRPWLIATFVVLCAGLGTAVVLAKRLLDAQQAQSRQIAVARALNDFLINNFIAVANPTVTGHYDVTVVEAARDAAQNIDKSFHDADPQIRGGLHAAMQSAFEGLSDVNASLTEGHKALDAFNSAKPADPMKLALVRITMAGLLAESSKLNEAAEQLQAADALMHQTPITDGTVVPRYMWARAHLAGARMDLTAAVEDYRRAWELAKGEFGLSPELLDRLQFSYADSLKMTGRFAEAQPLPASY